MFLERPRLHVPTPIDAGALILLIALALLLRLPYLADLPSFVHSDEAQMGLYTGLAYHGAMPPFRDHHVVERTLGGSSQQYVLGSSRRT